MQSPLDFHNHNVIDNIIPSSVKLLVQNKVIALNNKNDWDIEDMTCFALLSRLTYCISILDSICNRRACTYIDCQTFFLMFFQIKDILGKFSSESPLNIEKIFIKSIEEIEKTTRSKIINETKKDRFLSFVRAISFAHTISADNAAGFLLLKKHGGYFILSSISLIRLDGPTRGKEAFYFHVLLKARGVCRPMVFPIFTQELKDCILSMFNNANLGILK